MALSAIQLYRDILPKTNCRECGFLTCLAFASMVISEKLSLKKCPTFHGSCCCLRRRIEGAVCDGKWTKRYMAQDALEWARKRSASMNISDLRERIGGRLADQNGRPVLELPYFNDIVLITADAVTQRDGRPLTRWEQEFLQPYHRAAAFIRSGTERVWLNFPTRFQKSRP